MPSALRTLRMVALAGIACALCSQPALAHHCADFSDCGGNDGAMPAAVGIAVALAGLVGLGSFLETRFGSPTEPLASSPDDPVGALASSEGAVMITRESGEVVQAGAGTPVYLGDVIETGADGTYQIEFVDESTFTGSGGSILQIDEYVYSPPSSGHGGSWLRPIFIWTSEQIHRDPPGPPSGGTGMRG